MNKELFTSYKNFYRHQLLDDCIPFWMQSDLLDKEYGGYITCIDREGKQYNMDKSGWFQGRCLWTFSTLCNRYGKKQKWVDAAQLGVDFIEKHIADADGRMYFTLARDGSPLRKRRYMFTESFYVLSMAEYGLMTGDKTYIKKAEDCFENMLRMFRDPASDPYKITPKSYAETRQEVAVAVPMVLVSSAQLLRRCDPEKADYYTAIANEMAARIINIHWKPELGCVLETTGPNGEFIDTPAGRCINPGHSMENSWFLMNQYLHTKDEALLKNALQIFDTASERGWDKEYGGYIYFTDVNGRPPEQLEHDMKLWWVHNEAVIASLMLYCHTGNDKYADLFREFTEYAFQVFSDPENGEWYGYLRRDGKPTEPPCKGSTYKGPFHLPRMLMTVDTLLSRL